VRIGEDTSDLVFRVLFSTIFIGLGMEHLLSDALLQVLIPDWVEAKRAASIASGVILLLGGCSIAVGYRVHLGATVLGVFLVIVTIVVHAPGLLGQQAPVGLDPDARWVWTIYQRSNFVKNICLLGVCVHLITHQPGRYSLDQYLERRKRSRRPAATG
jgi:uncharacterized membrane protein YphA (DoxX/SURF4 family)